MLTGEEIDANARTYVDQAGKVLRTDEQLEIRHNSEWLDMTMEALFGLVRHVTVAQLLERDDFAKRFAAHQPISLLELLYPVLQGYDSVAVDADVELGGTDQTFNLLMGRAIQSAYGKPQQVVLTVPLLVGTDGVEKMSKSLGNHIGVTDPPDEMYGKTLSIPDAAMPSWYDLLLGSAPPEGVSPRDAKRALARALVTRFHGEAAAAEAEAAFDRVHIAREVPEDMPVRRADARRRRRPPARAAGRALRDVALGGAPQHRPGRRAARRRAGDRARPARRRARRPRAPGRQAALRAARRRPDGGPHRAAAPADEGEGQIVDLSAGLATRAALRGASRTAW